MGYAVMLFGCAGFAALGRATPTLQMVEVPTLPRGSSADCRAASCWIPQ